MSELDNLQHADGDKKQTENSIPIEDTSSAVSDSETNRTPEEVETPKQETKEPSEEPAAQDVSNDEDTGISDIKTEELSQEKVTPIDTAAIKDSEKTDTKENTEESEEPEHVEEISASNAKDAEDTDNKERHQLESKDYHAMSMDALADELEALIEGHKIQTISKHVNEIKSEFNNKYNALLEEKKDEFISEGGNLIDFYFTNDTKKRFSSAYKSYKTAISKYYKDREENLKDNLKNRLEIIEEIKGLLNIEENINSTYKLFKELQEKWRNAGPIPRDKYNNAWNTYHHHVERFYDFLHLNRDLRDMDFKHNLEQKLKIIDRAEALAKDDNVDRTFRELQELHKLWKEELGPVAKEHRDVIWERFSEATKTIHEKRQEYYGDLEKAFEKNLEKKNQIISAIETLNADQNNSHGSWQKKIKQLEALREDFFNAGKVPLKVNEATWAKFKEAVRAFNRNKNKFYKSLKKDQYENLQKKKDLIQVAEDNKNSDDFDTVTALMKKIQNDWKKIGHVPRKDSDKIWKQFKAACNYYFDRLHAEKKSESQHLYDAFDKKTALLEEVKSLKIPKIADDAIKVIQEKIALWNSLGSVPQNKRYIDGKFAKAIDNAFSQLDMDKGDLEMLKFESKMETLSANSDDTRILDNEQNFIRKRIDEIKSEINQQENNLQFFSNIKDDNPLVKDVHKKIEQQRKDLETWKAKLKKVRSLYN